MWSTDGKLTSMDAAIAGLVGASIGALTGLLGGLIANWNQQRADLTRWRQARADDLWKEERRSLIELTNLMAEGCQAVIWLTWSATVKPADAIGQEASEYDARMRILLPRLFSAQAAASGLSDEAFVKIAPLVERILALDTAVGGACTLLGAEPNEAVFLLRSYVEPANQLMRDMVLGVRSQLRTEHAETTLGLIDTGQEVLRG